jgi:redox-sensitive bicupin YhaK (pirin superfamily)
MAALRSVVRVVPAVRTLEGGGFPVRRPFPIPACDHVDPFLLLDEMGPVDWPPGTAIGAPDHPHRGFETVTYLLAGAMEHRDSAGHAGRLDPGDVQWMTAGDGVVHSELYAEDFRARGGRAHGFQLWVNLPARDKRMGPRYQELPAERIPRATSADGRATARVIAGSALGVTASIETRTPIQYVHWSLAPGAAATQPAPADHAAMVYVFAGTADVGGRRVADGELAQLGPGDAVALGAPAKGAPTELLFLSGVPLREPVARAGPFVMNTRAELFEAFADYEAGRLGAGAAARRR